MQYFPEEIETDLLARGLDIHHWWNRTVDEDGQRILSSRRLLAVLKHLPDDSAFRLAYREDWSEDKYITVGILNELRIMRSDNSVLAGGDPLEPVLVKSPAQQLADQFDSEQKQAIRGGINAQLYAPITE